MERNQLRAGRRRRARDSTGVAAARRFLFGNNRTAIAFMVLALAFCSVLCATINIRGVEAFGPSSSNLCANKIRTNKILPKASQHSTRTAADVAARPTSRISLSNSNDNEIGDVWSPGLRKIIGGVAGLGALETGYLTYAKLFAPNQATLFCGSSQSAVTSCDQVLNGPYANIPFLENVPLAALGFVAYSSVVGLALWPLVAKSDETDTQNRILLTALTTAMGTFSIFLMTLLFGVLNASCPYCIFSAADSFMLANLALIGGCLPEGSISSEQDDETRDTTGGKTVAVGFLGAFLGAVLVFGNGSIDAINNPSSSSSTLLATTISGGNPQQKEMLLYAPPEITTESSAQALRVGKSLQQMEAKMYGAHWCSHCFDQKQTLGKQVFGKDKNVDGQPMVRYVECSKDGIDTQFKVCKAKEIPGYPTWEIQGKLYPGEQSLDELEDLVKEIQSNKI